MSLWLLVIYIHGYAFVHAFDTKAECEQVGAMFKAHECVGVSK